MNTTTRQKLISQVCSFIELKSAQRIDNLPVEVGTSQSYAFSLLYVISVNLFISRYVKLVRRYKTASVYGMDVTQFILSHHMSPDRRKFEKDLHA